MTIIAICIFFFNDTATTEIYTLSLHDALPICMRRHHAGEVGGAARARDDGFQAALGRALRPLGDEIGRAVRRQRLRFRSEEHTSELQSQSNLVCRLLLEKKKIVTITKLRHIRS